MTSTEASGSDTIDGDPTYLGGGEPDGRYDDYYPEWVNQLAANVTLEGSLLDGAVQGPEAARNVVGTIRTFYENQQFSYVGPVGDTDWIEVYTARVGGEPIGCVVLVNREADGEVKHIAANYRPRSSVLLFSRLLGEKFADTPYAKYFLGSES